MTVKEALDRLNSWDHAAVTPKAATEVAEALGCPASIVPAHKMSDSRSQHKGLTIKGKKEGESEVLVDADRLAECICNRLGVDYSQKFGRGSQLRECVGELSKRFGV